MIRITPETPEDVEQTHSVVSAAFNRPNEADLIDRIRHSPQFIPELSLVAKEDENVVGHILLSRITVESPEQCFEAIALAPLSVLPSHQNQGIGSQLVQASLVQSRALGHTIVIVLGHPQYYPRFSFQPAKSYGIEAPFSVPDEAFMVQELAPGCLKQIYGTVRYPDYFNEV